MADTGEDITQATTATGILMLRAEEITEAAAQTVMLMAEELQAPELRQVHVPQAHQADVQV